MARIGAYREGHEVVEVARAGRLQAIEEASGRSHEPQVDIVGAAGAFKTKLKHQATLEGHLVAKFGVEPGKKAMKDEHLAEPVEVESGPRGTAQALLKSLLEGSG